MPPLPQTVTDLLDRALVAELAVVRADGQPVVHPLIPLWDGERVYMTSSVLFSKKLERIKRHPRVSLSITDPVAVGGLQARCTVQGDARIIEDDTHTSWERVLPLWRAKEPGIDFFLGKRVALPLFFERSIIEITPRRILWWDDGNTTKAPQVLDLEQGVAA
jgi:nitroimidazol reductase NimA-like FMN-containing flavoprotein (pyridoxamine 5'-phosphate oxidase superfamily)